MSTTTPPNPHATFNPQDYEATGYLTKAEATVLYCSKAYADARYFKLIGGTISGAVSVTSTTQSTSTATGSVTTLGGVGVARNLYVGGDTRVQSTTLATSVGTGALVVSGGFSVAYDTYSNGRFITTSLIDGTPALTGSIVTYGGIAADKTICARQLTAYGTGSITPGTLATGALQVSAGGISALESIQTTTGQVYTGNGALATPGFAFASNPNCGVHRLSANSVGFVCNGATALATTTSGAYVVGRLGVGLSSVPGSNQLYVQTFSGSLVTPLVLANSTSGGPVRQLLQSTAADSYTIWDTGSYGSHVGIRQSDGFVCVGTTSASPTTGPNQITISPAGVVNISSLEISGTAFAAPTQQIIASSAVNTASVYFGRPMPTTASCTVRATLLAPAVIALELSSTFWVASATTATCVLATALAAAYRPAITLNRSFRMYTSAAWVNARIIISSAGVVTVDHSFISGTSYAFSDMINYQTDSRSY